MKFSCRQRCLVALVSTLLAMGSQRVARADNNFDSLLSVGLCGSSNCEYLINCQDWQLAQLKPAALAALHLLQQAPTYLHNGPAIADSELTIWFGVQKSDTQAWNNQTAVIAFWTDEAISQLTTVGAAATAAKGIYPAKFNCSPGDAPGSGEAAAFVDRADIGKVNGTVSLTNAFWGLDLTTRDTLGPGSKAGAIIHELFHLLGAYDLKDDPRFDPAVFNPQMITDPIKYARWVAVVGGPFYASYNAVNWESYMQSMPDPGL